MDSSANYGAVGSDAAGTGGTAPTSQPQDIRNSASGRREEKLRSASGEGTELTGLIPTTSVEKNAPPAKEKPPISTRMAIFLVVNYMIGSGILNTPQTFRDSGIAATTVLYILACLAVWVGSVALIKAAEEQQQLQQPPLSETAMTVEEGGKEEGGRSGRAAHAKTKYAILAEESMGEAGPYIIDGVIAVQNGGAVCSYVIILGGLATSLLSGFLEWLEVTPGWWDGFYVVMPVVVFCFVLWPSSWESFSEIVWVDPLAVLSLATISCLLVFVIEKWAFPSESVSVAADLAMGTPLVWWNWSGFFRKVGSVVFGITFAPAAFHAYDPMKHRNLNEWKYVVTTSVLVGGAMCYLMGIFGYLSFGPATEGDILDNFARGWVATILKCSVAGHLVCYIPGETIVLRDSVCGLLDIDKSSLNDRDRQVSTFFILAAIVGAVVLLTAFGLAQGEAFGYILDFTGGVTVSLTSFVLPAYIYLKGSENQSHGEGRDGYRLACKILFVFGAALILGVLTSIFHNPFATVVICVAVFGGLFWSRATLMAP
eukprot:g9957.t1